MLKRVCTLMLVFTIFMTGTTAFAADAPSSWAKADVQEAIKLGIVPDRLQSNYQAPITREEFAELIVQMIFAKQKNESHGNYYWDYDNFLKQVTVDTQFEDADQKHVKVAFAFGSINGVTDTRFEPNKEITRQEAATMIMNTVHASAAIKYSGNKYLKYQDYNKIAKWALPAVEAVNVSGYMEGIGNKFDYDSLFTREQSILTMVRIYKSSYNAIIYLKGNLPIWAGSDDLFYNIGKNYVNVNYKDDDDPYNDTQLERELRSIWKRESFTSDLRETDFKKAIILYVFNPVLKLGTYDFMVSPTLKGESVKVDYGYMTVETYTEDSLMTFKYKELSGYMNLVAGYTYGYPEVEVKAKLIK